jgi:hypothetical protein
MKSHHRKDGTFRVGHTVRQAGPEPADHILTMKLPGSTKGRWVQAARQEGKTLTEWVKAACTRALDNRQTQ